MERSLILAAAFVGAMVLCWKTGYGAGHRDGMEDAPKSEALLVEQAKAMQAFEARIDAEPTKEEYLFSMLYEIMEPYILDRLDDGHRNIPEPFPEDEITSLMEEYVLEEISKEQKAEEEFRNSYDEGRDPIDD